MFEIDKLKTATLVREDSNKHLNQQVEKMQREITLGIQKSDVIQRMCDESDKKVHKLQAQFDEYIEKKKVQRQEAWRVEYGEQAKIETDSKIQFMLNLSNKMIAVASQ